MSVQCANAAGAPMICSRVDYCKSIHSYKQNPLIAPYPYRLYASIASNRPTNILFHNQAHNENGWWPHPKQMRQSIVTLKSKITSLNFFFKLTHCRLWGLVGSYPTEESSTKGKSLWKTIISKIVFPSWTQNTHSLTLSLHSLLSTLIFSTWMMVKKFLTRY